MSIITITKEKERLDIDVIYDFLNTSYWAKDRTKTMVSRTIENSICYGVYCQNEQVGFARVVSDKVIFAYLMDVFILPQYRGNGYGKSLVEYILNDDDLKNVKNWMLETSDAHGLYAKYGFQTHIEPFKVMKRINTI